MTKKFGFIGAHGSGKSTLANLVANLLQKQGKHVCQIGSIARRCPFGVSEQTNIESQIWILLERVKLEVEVMEQNKPEYLVCERTVFDDYAYYSRISDEAILVEETAEQDIYEVAGKRYTYGELMVYDAIYRNISESWIESYDKIFYLKPLMLERDGVRPNEEEYQKDIDERITTLLKENRVPYTIVHVDTLENRAKIIMEELK